MKAFVKLNLIILVAAGLPVTGCRSERPQKLAACLDRMVEMRSSWRRVQRALQVARSDQQSPLAQAVTTAQRQLSAANESSSSCFGQSDPTQCFENVRQRTQAATQALAAAQAVLAAIDPDTVNSIFEANPIEALERGRVFSNPPAGVAGVELQAARTATEAMWGACRVVCRDLQCSGR